MRKADAMTWVRIVFAPIFFILYMVPEWTGSFGNFSIFIIWPLYLFAEFTDFLDGFFARKYNEVSDFGKIFDPFADVILHVTAFFCFASTGHAPIWALFLIVLREIAIQFVRLLAQKEGFAMGAQMSGKLKTVIYIATGFFSLFIVSIERLGFAGNMPMDIFATVNIVMYVICVVLSYFSFAQYLGIFAKLKKKK